MFLELKLFTRIFIYKRRRKYRYVSRNNVDSPSDGIKRLSFPFARLKHVELNYNYKGPIYSAFYLFFSSPSPRAVRLFHRNLSPLADTLTESTLPPGTHDLVTN